MLCERLNAGEALNQNYILIFHFVSPYCAHITMSETLATLMFL